MRRRGFVAVLAIVSCGVWAWNTSLFAKRAERPEVKLIAHRGVHQTYHRRDLKNDTCTAERIYPHQHSFLENTIDSMRAAFAAGADVVELDVHLTRDGVFAVFHDWTVDCRTNGSGVTHHLDMASLKKLDIGHGYTADGGKTYPFRGAGVGQMPTLQEVFDALPQGRFLINFKSRRSEDGAALATMVNEAPRWRSAVFGVYGGEAPTRRSLELLRHLRGYDKSSVKGCLLSYITYGWTGILPRDCRNTYVPIPSNFAWLLWGWPHRFAQRIREAGSEIILLGAYDGTEGSTGIDRLSDLDSIPKDFDGYIWTNRIEIIGPALKPNSIAPGAQGASQVRVLESPSSTPR